MDSIRMEARRLYDIAYSEDGRDRFFDALRDFFEKATSHADRDDVVSILQDLHEKGRERNAAIQQKIDDLLNRQPDSISGACFLTESDALAYMADIRRGRTGEWLIKFPAHVIAYDALDIVNAYRED